MIIFSFSIYLKQVVETKWARTSFVIFICEISTLEIIRVYAAIQTISLRFAVGYKSSHAESIVGTKD